MSFSSAGVTSDCARQLFQSGDVELILPISGNNFGFFNGEKRSVVGRGGVHCFQDPLSYSA